MRGPGIDLGAALGGLRADQADPYAGADRENATRLVALLGLLVGLLSLAFLPLDPPSDRGAFGWVVAVILALVSVGGARRLLRASTPPSFGALLALSYLGIVQVGALVWLTGGAGSAYQSLFLIWLGAGMGIHPPRRAGVFLLATAVAASAPLLYDGWSGSAAASIAANLLLWSAIGGAMLALMVGVRAQRVRLRASELHESELARVDALTGLGNRRAFDEALEMEMARCRRAGSSLSVLLVDLDHFKQINDELGHMEGDRCLAATAVAVTGAVRASDRAFRWGGDEFAVLLPETDFAGAEKVAASVCAEVLNKCSDARGRPLSLSAGAVEADPAFEIDESLGRVDLQLRARKRERAAREPHPR